MYRGLKPRVPPTPSPDGLKALRRIVAECGGLEAAGLYLAWTFQSQDTYARQLRGDAPWPGGDITARTDLVSLSRHIPPRLAQAQAWQARGRGGRPSAERVTSNGLEDALAEIAELEGRSLRPRPNTLDAEFEVVR